MMSAAPDEPAAGKFAPCIKVVEYDETGADVREIDDLERFSEIAVSLGSRCTFWVHVNQTTNETTMNRVGAAFHIPALIMEDVRNTQHRPKLEDTGDFLFTAMKIIEVNSDNTDFVFGHLSILLFNTGLISFQADGRDLFQPIWAKLTNKPGKLRAQKPDYLAYSLMDMVVDGYLTVSDHLDERIDDTETDLEKGPDLETLHQIHGLKRQSIEVRKAVIPFRETAYFMQRADHPLLSSKNRDAYRDLYDHVVQTIDALEGFREMATGLLELYHSTISSRMNEVMKVLTMISTIFIPLGFIAGVYGMNFQHIPELTWKYGYLFVWLTFICVGGFMLLFFKWKKWL